jgi:RimJ/RimL family protein N-acetyltransferase
MVMVRSVSTADDMADQATDPTVSFRPLTDDDLPLLHRWLNEPGVVRFWEGDDVSWEGVVREYGSANTDPGEHWLATIEDRPVGWIQCYAWSDYPDEAAPYWSLGVERTAAGIDYLVGEVAARGRGLGTAIIRSFVAGIVFGRHPEWTQAATAANQDNVASWRALENAGFRFVGTFDDEHGTFRAMVCDRTLPAP